MKVPPDFAPPARAEGAAPAPPVLLCGFGSPAVCLRGSGNLRLPKAWAFGHALFPFAPSGACTLRLRLRVSLPSGSASPSVLLRTHRSRLRRLLAGLGTLRFPRPANEIFLIL